MEEFNRRTIAENFDYTYDLVNSICGNYIAEGSSRIVYDYLFMKGHVIKIAKNGSRDNILEYEFYNDLRFQDSKKWLAPCVWISDNGVYMVQKKVTPITEKSKHLMPNQIPAFLTDVKFDNFGFIGKQLVCVDYAFSSFYCNSNHTNKMKKFVSHLGEK